MWDVMENGPAGWETFGREREDRMRGMRRQRIAEGGREASDRCGIMNLRQSERG